MRYFTSSMKPIVFTLLVVFSQLAIAQKMSKKVYKQQVQDSIFTVTSTPLVVNDLQCYWAYQVSQYVDKKDFVKILNQQLILSESGRVLFETTNSYDNAFNKSHHTISDLEQYGTYNLSCTDINKDEFCDFRVVLSRAGAGANIEYKTFIFDPDAKVFKHSKLFSGANVEYDFKKNRIVQWFKSGVDSYGYYYLNLTPAQDEIEFKEQVIVRGPKILYKKYKGEAVIKEITTNLDEYGNFEFVLERN